MYTCVKMAPDTVYIITDKNTFDMPDGKWKMYIQINNRQAVRVRCSRAHLY